MSGGKQEGTCWSYSRITTFEHCPLSYKLQYIDRLPQTNNAFAEYGLLCHGLLERFATGELMAFDLTDMYEEVYDRHVIHAFPPFPRALGTRYYEAGLAYFTGFTGFGAEYDILSVEDRFTMEIGGYPFTGVVDLLLRDVQTGKLILTDHKSKASKSARRDLAKLNRQLYIYAAYIKERYGAFPDTLRFNLFREQEIVDTQFAQKKYDKTLAWVKDMIETIMAEQEFPPCKPDYFCRFLCGVSAYCPVAQELATQWHDKGGFA